VLTEETLGNTAAWMEHTPYKLLSWLAQETGMSQQFARKATKLLKFQP
jgi:hypothetical protein